MNELIDGIKILLTLVVVLSTMFIVVPVLSGVFAAIAIGGLILFVIIGTVYEIFN